MTYNEWCKLSDMERKVYLRTYQRAMWQEHATTNEPLYTGYKRNYRKPKWHKNEYWHERWEHVARCWKDQRGKGRNKRNTQYRPVCA